MKKMILGIGLCLIAACSGAQTMVNSAQVRVTTNEYPGMADVGVTNLSQVLMGIYSDIPTTNEYATHQYVADAISPLATTGEVAAVDDRIDDLLIQLNDGTNITIEVTANATNLLNYNFYPTNIQGGLVVQINETNVFIGTNQINGIDGTNGVNGVDGTNGVNGIDGTNGVNGIDGTNGVDGVDGEDGYTGIIPYSNIANIVISGAGTYSNVMPVFTSDTPPAGSWDHTGSAQDANREWWKMFDGILTNYFQKLVTGSTYGYRYTFASPTKIERYSIVAPAQLGGGILPTAWRFYGVTNGVQFMLDDKIGGASPQWSTTNSYVIASPVTCDSYVFTNISGSYAIVPEMWLEVLSPYVTSTVSVIDYTNNQTVISGNGNPVVVSSNLTVLGNVIASGSNSINGYVSTNGGTITGPIVYMPETNSPGQHDLVNAEWVRSLFNNGFYFYNSTNETPSGYAPTTYVYSVSNPSAMIPKSFTIVSNNQYVSAIITPTMITNAHGPVVVNIWATRTTGGGDAVSIKPEIYFTIDKTNTIFEAEDVQPQVIEEGTNLYSWVISFPDQTNSAYAVRRIKATSMAGTPVLTILGGNGYPSTLSIASAIQGINGTNGADGLDSSLVTSNVNGYGIVNVTGSSNGLAIGFGIFQTTNAVPAPTNTNTWNVYAAVVGGTNFLMAVDSATNRTYLSGAAGVNGTNGVNPTGALTNGFVGTAGFSNNVTIAGTATVGRITLTGGVVDSTASDVILRANSAQVFRGIVANAWIDQASQWFQVGSSSGNGLFTAAAGTTFARFGIVASKFQIVDTAFGATMLPPVDMFEIVNASNRLFAVTTTGAIKTGGSTALNKTNYFDVGGVANAGTNIFKNGLLIYSVP